MSNYLVFDKIVNLLWQIFYSFGLIFIALKVQKLINNIVIWSHCTLNSSFRRYYPLNQPIILNRINEGVLKVNLDVDYIGDFWRRFKNLIQQIMAFFKNRIGLWGSTTARSDLWIPARVRERGIRICCKMLNAINYCCTKGKCPQPGGFVGSSAPSQPSASGSMLFLRKYYLSLNCEK